MTEPSAGRGPRRWLRRFLDQCLVEVLAEREAELERLRRVIDVQAAELERLRRTIDRYDAELARLREALRVKQVVVERLERKAGRPPVGAA